MSNIKDHYPSKLKELLAKKSKKYENTEYEGRVIKILYSAANYCVAFLEDIKTKETIKIVCNYTIRQYDDIKIHGKWVEKSKWGWQFETNCMETNLDLDRNGLIKFLTKNPDIHGIGPRRASDIVKYFGENFDEIVTNDYQQIIDKLKISENIVKNLHTVWVTSKILNKNVVNLSSYPLTQEQIKSLIRIYGNDAADIIKNKPYELIPIIKDFGFKTADEIALSNGIDPQDNKRLQASVDFVCNITIQMAGGHCWIEEKELIDEMRELLRLKNQTIINFLYNNLDDTKIKQFVDDDITKYSSSRIFHQEKYVVNYIRENSYEVGDFQYSSQMDKFDLSTLNDKQKKAVINAFKYKFSIISGKAGTGKTYVISTIIQFFRSIGLQISCVAPTGKASKRMEEMTDYPASTIHRFLAFNGENFCFNKNNKKEDVDVIFVDEFSMVDISLAYSLFSALGEHVKIIIVGDHNQLPPIGTGNIFNDLMKYGADINCTITELNEIVRQAGNLKKNSVEILNGNISMENTDDWKVAVDEAFMDPENIRKVILQKMSNCKKTMKYDSEDIQVIMPMKVRECGTIMLNKELQKVIQKFKYGIDIRIKDGPDILYQFDRVIQLSNDYSIEVMNGTLGTVIEASKDNIVIKFEGDNIITYTKDDSRLKNISLAYALTIHKTQGSEFPCVIVAIHSSQSFMLNKNLLYTAITRAKEKVILIGDNKAIEIALSKNNHNIKRTNFEYIKNIKD